MCTLLFIMFGFILVLQKSYKEFGLFGIIGFCLIWTFISAEEDRLAVMGYSVVISGLACLIAWAVNQNKE